MTTSRRTSAVRRTAGARKAGAGRGTGGSREPGTGRAIRQCRDVIELLTEYMEGTLRATDARRLEAHLGGCGPCAGFLDSLRKTRAAVLALRARKVPAACSRELRALLRKRPGGTRPGRSKSGR